MLKGNKPISFILILVFFVMTAYMGCGGGGDSSSDPRNNDDESTVALFLADGPTDEFDSIWIEVTQISLIPQGDETPVVIYETDFATPLDLLTLQDDDLLLAVNSEVPTGTYNKIRLTVERVYGQPKGGDLSIDFHLASNKIDLNPREEIVVTQGETLSLRLDIDAEKSIHIAGSKYNFRPVVFVDAGPMTDPRRCHHLINGEISELLYADQDSETVIGFRMTPFNGIANLDVYFQDNIVIFDEKGQVSDPEALAEGQDVGINGKLDTDGRFLAEMVVIGEVDLIFGDVQSTVEDNQFLLRPGSHWDDPNFPESIMPDTEMKKVSLSDGTMIMLGDDEVNADQIKPGLKARVVGKMDNDSETMNAIAVFLKSRQIVGRLVAIETVDGGSMLTVKTHMGAPYDPPAEDSEPDETKRQGCYAEEEIKVFLPDSAPIDAKGGSELTIDTLMAMVKCENYPRIQVAVDDSVELDGAIQASALMVWPEMIKLIVESVDVDNGIIKGRTGYKYKDGETVQVSVPEGTPIWMHKDEAQEPITLKDIESEDHLLIAALLVTCEPVGYEAVTIVKMPGCVPPDDPCQPKKRTIEIKVEKIDIDENMIQGATRGANATLIEVTEDTELVDKTQGEPVEMNLEDIQVGDTLICEILLLCDVETAQALTVTRVNLDGDDPTPPHDECMPHDVNKDVVVHTVNQDERIIVTTQKEKILVPEGTPIYVEGQNGEERLTLADLNSEDVLEITATQTCGDDPALIAHVIIKYTATDKTLI